MLPPPKNGACVLAVFDSRIGVETSSMGANEKCDETPKAFFLDVLEARGASLILLGLGGLVRREGHVPRKVIDGGPRDFRLVDFQSVELAELPGLCWSSCPACSFTGAACSDSSLLQLLVEPRAEARSLEGNLKGLL